MLMIFLGSLTIMYTAFMNHFQPAVMVQPIPESSTGVIPSIVPDAESTISATEASPAATATLSGNQR